MSTPLSSRCWTVVVNLILICALLVCVAHAQLATVNMTRVVESLSRQFENIRGEGMGVDDIEVR